MQLHMTYSMEDSLAEDIYSLSGISRTFVFGDNHCTVLPHIKRMGEKAFAYHISVLLEGNRSNASEQFACLQEPLRRN